MPSWFPFQYHDVKQWHARGLPISTPSDQAAKYLDATVTQIVLASPDPELCGIEKTMEKVIACDPDFLLPKTLSLGFEAMATNTLKYPEVKKKIFNLKEESKQRKLSEWELRHMDATLALADDDYATACSVWEDILIDHPKDVLALHLLFYGHLHMGRRRGLRDSVYRVAAHYPEEDRYFGNVRGKLCFGFEENCQFDAALNEGMTALGHTPKDAWAIHSVSHVYHETQRPTKGISFLEERDSDWIDNDSLNVHIWWHKGLFFLSMGEFESALSLYDEKVKSLSFKTKLPFPLSDATALLLRLEMEGFQPKSGQSLKDRWRELGQVYSEHLYQSINSTFYDFHCLLGTLLGDQPIAAQTLRENMLDQAAKYRNERNPSYNCYVAHKVGVPLADATVAFSQGNYDECVKLLHPIRMECQELLGGSHAQKDIIDLMLIRAAIKSSRGPRLARQLLDERIARSQSHVKQDEADEDKLLSRLSQEIVALH